MKYDNWIGKGFDRWSTGEYSPGQLDALHDFINSFILLSGAYRSGKSEIGARLALRHATLFPNAKVGIFRRHLASLKKSTLRTCLELCHRSWLLPGSDGWSNTELEAHLINGSTIYFIGCDSPDKLGSIELTFAFIDEASEISEESLGMIQGRLSGQLTYPPNFHTLPQDTQTFIEITKDIRQVYLACNPKSKHHFLYKRFIKDPKPGHISYNSNSVSNPNLPEVYLLNNLSAYAKPGVSQDWILEQIRLIRSGEKPANGLHLQPYLTEFGQRNLLGLWVALEGAIYQLSEDTHLVTKAPSSWGKPTGKLIAGVDFGFHSPRAILLQEYAPKLTDAYGLPIKSKSNYLAIRYWNEAEATDDDLISCLETWDSEYNIHRIYMPHDRPAAKRTANVPSEPPKYAPPKPKYSPESPSYPAS